jgi:hypothetical protein
MNVEIRTKAAPFFFRENINGVFVAVYRSSLAHTQYRGDNKFDLC